MEFPDQLKKPAPTRHPGFDALDDFLWDAASWDPDVEQALQDSRLDGSDRELAAAAQRLLDEGVLAEPGMVYRAMRLLADVGALSVENLGTRAGRPRDPLRPGGLAIGREAERIQGVRAVGAARAVTRGRPGISMVCITGPAGVGKTRLAEEIVMACEQEGTTPRLEVWLSRAAVGAGLRQRAVTSHDALLDLLLQLGVAEADVPAIPAERKARYAAELARQRPVILIDGAIDEQQVLDLLPPADGAVVVTSRRHLPGLFGWGAGWLPLKPLSPAGSRLLIKACFQALGAEPLGAEPSGAEPSGAQPPGAQPPGAQPPGAQPPGAQPSGAQPSDAQPPDAQPPDAQPSGAQPPGAQPLEAMPDDAVITAISEMGRGMPVPTIAVSRWMATTARNVLSRWIATAATDDMPAAARNDAAERVLRETLAELSAALRNQTRVPSGLAQADEIPAFDAMAAVFRLLSEDQRAVVQALGLLRLPETGILVTCLATGLGEDRARAALEQLADMRLIARASSGQSWTMDPHVADYAHADALASGQLDEPGLGEMLGRVIDVYRTRAENLRDLMSAPGPGSLAPPREKGTGGTQPPEGQLHEWSATQWEQERDSIVTVLHAAAASTRPALARDLAAAFMDAASLADGRESGWRETDSYMAPIMVIARAADDRGLQARVLQRFAGHTERQGDSAGADTLRNAAADVRGARGDARTPDIGPAPDRNATAGHEGNPIPVPAGQAAARDSLEHVERIVREPAVAAPPPVLFGAKAYAR